MLCPILLALTIQPAAAESRAVPVKIKVVGGILLTAGPTMDFGSVYVPPAVGALTLLMDKGGVVTPSVSTVKKTGASIPGSITVQGAKSTNVTMSADVINTPLTHEDGSETATFHFDPGKQTHLAHPSITLKETDGTGVYTFGGEVKFAKTPVAGTYAGDVTFSVNY